MQKFKLSINDFTFKNGAGSLVQLQVFDQHKNSVVVGIDSFADLFRLQSEIAEFLENCQAKLCENGTKQRKTRES